MPDEFDDRTRPYETLAISLNDLLAHAEDLNLDGPVRSRRLSLAITAMEEALMWLRRERDIRKAEEPNAS